MYHVCFHRNGAVHHCSENLETCSIVELDKLCVNMAKRVLISIMEAQDVPVENLSDTTFKVCVCVQVTLSSLMSAIFDIRYSNCIYRSDVPEPSN